MATGSNHAALAALTMADVERLYAALLRLDAIDDALVATSLQAKPAIRELLRDVHAVCHGLIRKAARRACKRGAQGHYSRKKLPPGLMEMLIEMAGSPEVAEAPEDDVVRSEPD